MRTERQSRNDDREVPTELVLHCIREQAEERRFPGIQLGHGARLPVAGDEFNRMCASIGDAAVIVPGHGPLADADGVRAVSDYLRFVDEGTRLRHEAGMTSAETVLDLHAELDATPFGSWGDPERLVINVETIWAGLEPGYARPSIMKLFSRMARLAGSLSP